MKYFNSGLPNRRPIAEFTIRSTSEDLGCLRLLLFFFATHVGVPGYTGEYSWLGYLSYSVKNEQYFTVAIILVLVISKFVLGAYTVAQVYHCD